jgi:hypothetical protein
MHLCGDQIATVLQLPTVAPLDGEATKRKASVVA